MEEVESKMLVYINNAKNAIELAKTVQEVKEIRDKAITLQELAKRQKRGLHVQNAVAEIRLYAERKAGGILKETELNKGVRMEGTRRLHDETTVKLNDVGISKRDSSNWQRISDIPEDQFIESIEVYKEKEKEITTNAFLDIAREIKTKDKRREMDAAGKKIQITNEFIDFRLGDFKEALADVPDNSIDLIITDPPYPEKYLHLYEQLSKFANDKLKPSGFCVAYAGQYFLPEVIERMNKSLIYYWVFCLYHKGGTKIVHGRYIMNRWKPILIYQKEPVKKIDSVIQDYVISEQSEKQEHEWQQSISGISELIKYFSNIGDMILDPFVGGGTTLCCAVKLKRKCIGAEIDEKTYNIAKARLKECLVE